MPHEKLEPGTAISDPQVAQARAWGFPFSSKASEMKSITRNDINKDFLLKAEERGYKPYVDHLKADRNKTSDFYLGSVQKCIRDEKGIKFFVNIDMFDIGYLGVPGLSVSAEIQYNSHSDDKPFVDVRRAVDDLDETEAFFDHMWKVMKFDYYEEF
jgi:hypothetical protein